MLYCVEGRGIKYHEMFRDLLAVVSMHILEPQSRTFPLYMTVWQLHSILYLEKSRDIWDSAVGHVRLGLGLDCRPKVHSLLIWVGASGKICSVRSKVGMSVLMSTFIVLKSLGAMAGIMLMLQSLVAGISVCRWVRPAVMPRLMQQS